MAITQLFSSIWLVLIALISANIPQTWALTASEDFLYPSLATESPIIGNSNSGEGWNGEWQGDDGILYNAETDLIYKNYPLIQPLNSGCVFSQKSNYRAIYRELAVPVSGEVWFSYVFRKGGTGSGGLMLNANGENATNFETNWSVMVNPQGQLIVNTNGIKTNITEVKNAEDYLILGRVLTDGGFDLWINPDINIVVDRKGLLGSSHEPNYSDPSAINPASITSLGISAYRGQGASSVMRIDALRISDGDGNADLAFRNVTSHD